MQHRQNKLNGIKLSDSAGLPIAPYLAVHSFGTIHPKENVVHVEFEAELHPTGKQPSVELLSIWRDVSGHNFLKLEPFDCFRTNVILTYLRIGVHSTPDC